MNDPLRPAGEQGRGATGALTSETTDEEFIPAERRDAVDPDHKASVTTQRHEHQEDSEGGPREADDLQAQGDQDRT